MKLAPIALRTLLAATALTLSAQAALAADYVTKAQDLGALAPPVSLVYGSAFNDQDPATDGVQLALSSGTTTLTPADHFYDDYAFSIGGTSFSTVAATIDLGSVLSIGDLRVRLYSGTLAQTTTGPVGANLIQNWSNASLITSGSGPVTVINPVALGAGNYVLEVRGLITGTSGGAYAGALNLAPVAAVPEPGALGLVLAGFGVLAMVSRRRRDEATA